MRQLDFGLTLFAAGACFAFLSSSGSADGEQSWHSGEVQSGLFNQHGLVVPNGKAPRGPRSIVLEWQRSRVWSTAAKNQAAAGFAAGTRLSLISFANVSSVIGVCADGPDDDQPPPPVSVTSGGYNNTCSTAGGQATAGQCSVINSTSAGACSVDQNTPGSNTFCSAGRSGSPNNTFPSACSAINNTNASTCSTNASGTAGSPLQCSVQGGSGNPAKNLSCSTSGGSGQSCSTGVNAGGSTHGNSESDKRELLRHRPVRGGQFLFRLRQRGRELAESMQCRQ